MLQSHRFDVGHDKVVCNCADGLVAWKSLHVGAERGVDCEHIRVLRTRLAE